MTTGAARISWAARTFTLATLGALSAAFTARDPHALLLVALLALGVTAHVATRLRLPLWLGTGLEAALVAAVVSLGLPGASTLSLYVCIPVLAAGLTVGARGVLAAVTLQVVLVVAVTSAGAAPWNPVTAQLWITAFLTGLGLGLLGSYVRALEAASDAIDRDYRTARDLLRRLRDLSGQLSTGLDPAEIADVVLARTRDQFTDAGTAVLTVSPDSGVVHPVRYSSDAAVERLLGSDEAVRSAWRDGVPATAPSDDPDHPGWRAIPLLVDGVAVAVVVGIAPPHRVPAPDQAELATLALRLDAGLAFADLRSAATLEERQRLAREVHDGVAQDVASLGYLVDALHDDATGDVARGLEELRTAVRDVVKELRYSIFDLRHELHSEEGLGTALAGVARQVGSRSDLRVHLTLDEQAVRIRPDVENELLRIGQEAMNNARRHSGARNLWVTCTVHPPMAEVVVRDDGVWSASARPDSHGLRIMAERAARIGGELEVEPGDEGRGTMVRVTVGLASRPQDSVFRDGCAPEQGSATTKPGASPVIAEFTP